MTRTELAEKETCAQVVLTTETMTLTTETPKEGLTMTIEDAKKAKRRPTREQKARWKTNALMRKYDDETKGTALRVYTEALDYGKVKVEATLDHAEEAVRNYLWGDWTFDDLWDLAREFGVKPRGFHDNSWDMGEGYDGQIIDRLSDIISKIGFRLREEEGLAEKQAEASEAEASGSGEKTETTKEEKPMKKVTVKELRAEARELGIKGYMRMTKGELKEALLIAEVEYAARDGESMKQTTIEELRSEAKEIGVVGYKRMTRVELVKRLSDLRKHFHSELEEKAEESETQKACDGSLAEEDEDSPVSLEKYYEEKMRKDFNEFEKRLYGNESEIAESAETSKDEATMTVRPKGRKVSPEVALASIETLNEESDIRAVLKDCTTKQIREICERLVGVKYCIERIVPRKAELIESSLSLILSDKERDAFDRKTVEEKANYLMERTRKAYQDWQNPDIDLLRHCGLCELIEIALRIGLKADQQDMKLPLEQEVMHGINRKLYEQRKHSRDASEKRLDWEGVSKTIEELKSEDIDDRESHLKSLTRPELEQIASEMGVSYRDGMTTPQLQRQIKMELDEEGYREQLKKWHELIEEVHQEEGKQQVSNRGYGAKREKEGSDSKVA